MYPSVRIGLPAALILALALAAAAVAQNPNTPRPAERVVGSVNEQPITEKELIGLLGQFQIPPGNEQRAYDSAMELLVNTKVLEQFLAKAAPPPSPAEVQQVLDQYAKGLQEQQTSLEAALADTGTTIGEFRSRIGRSLQWKNYVSGRANDAELRRYIQINEDVFSGTQVKASHILLKLPPEADDASKAEVRQKLESIKKEIESGQTTFAEAANRLSEDERNLELKNGGDLELFPRKGAYIEAFAAAAFSMKDKPMGTVSDPVETEYGLHLIQLTEVKPGQTLDATAILADPQNRQLVMNQYAAELQNQIVESERAKAKVEVRPMPDDLFQTELYKQMTAEPAPLSTSVQSGVAPTQRQAAPPGGAPSPGPGR